MAATTVKIYTTHGDTMALQKADIIGISSLPVSFEQ
ncbi:MAG: hypothetical protein ACJAST_003546 [Halopseudomonas sp.]